MTQNIFKRIGKKIFFYSILVVFLTGVLVFFIARNTIQGHKNTQKTVFSPIPTTTAIHTTEESTKYTCNDLLVLVNKSNGLPATYTPSDLVYLKDYSLAATQSYLQIRSMVVPDLKNMFNDIAKENIDLKVVSSFRSFSDQEKVYNGYPPDTRDTFSAKPGYSQHQLGTAIDVSTNEINYGLDPSFSNTKAGKWLLANAYKYGFYISYPEGKDQVTGYEYEPWHYRYIGVSNALSLLNSRLIMETYLTKYGTKPNC